MHEMFALTVLDAPSYPNLYADVALAWMLVQLLNDTKPRWWWGRMRRLQHRSRMSVARVKLTLADAAFHMYRADHMVW